MQLNNKLLVKPYSYPLTLHYRRPPKQGCSTSTLARELYLFGVNANDLQMTPQQMTPQMTFV